MKKKLHKLIVFFLLCSVHCTAQTTGFNYESPITSVDSSGFYNIVLTPALNAHLKTDYSDLRIVNDSGKWVPHILIVPGNEIINEPKPQPLKIIKRANDKSGSEIIIEGDTSKFSYLLLFLKNTVAERYCDLTGSDDMNSWFTINDSIKIIPVQTEDQGISKFALLFPPVSYKYFRISINNNGREPFNIINAATTKINYTISNKYYPVVENPQCSISQMDSGNVSYIKVQQSAAYHFEKIALKLSGVKYFNRNAEIYIPSSGTHSFYNPGRLIRTLILSNNSTLQFDVPLTNTDFFYIIIQNDDNPPLKVEQVKTFSDYSVATAYFEKGNHYKLLLNNMAAAAPNYDLSIDDITLKESIQYVGIGKIISIQKPAITPQPKDNSKKIIWLTITLAAIVLGFFTYRLVTDMNKSKS